MLRHMAFFEELAKTSEADANWRAASAGLVVLRLVDQWIADGPRETDAWILASVRDAIAEMDETTPVRRILSSVVDAIADAKKVDVRAIIPRLMAYAQSLEYDAKWRLGIDVYKTIIGFGHPTEDADVVVVAYIQYAACLRNVGDLSAAFEACQRAQDVAIAVGDVVGVLRGRIGEARVGIARGNLPLAEQILDQTIQLAEQKALPEVRWRALHERATVAGMRGEFDRAIQFAYDALPFAASQRDRDRILTDIATGFSMLGLFDIARDAYLVLNVTAQDQYIRWTSGLNMMEIAARQGAEPMFDRLRREFESTEFPPYLHAKYLITVGNGYRLLGRPELGVQYLEEAIEYATAKELNQLVFEAEEGLAASRTHAIRQFPSAPIPVPNEILGVAEAIRAMRDHAAVGD